MDHVQVKQKLLEWRDGTLVEAERREIADHLRQCAGCWQFGQRWESIAELFSEKPSMETSEFFIQQVMERVRRPEPVRLLPKPIWWWVPVLAPSLVLLLMALIGSRPVVSTETLLERVGTDWSGSVELARGPASGDLLELLGEES